ncbi:hypothetical protein C6496_08085 [Candidatus Poribacteria bacterium]|nr:MAG: hypothetical protein C6496_08085 [Candidatus Poribacteria bacterium]
MLENDVQLIHRFLSGDDEAFSALVQRHQKSVHALAWRKVGDFHFAEEITQDVFLQVYKKLSTLKNPNQFVGWLYVIVNRLCINWLQRHRPPTQSLDNMPAEQIEEASYTRYVAEQLDLEITEHRHEIVKRLLQQLPESERTVVTLYYLGEMSVKEIGKSLGVSVNTIKSRLSRARKRLQAQGAELLVSEVLGGIQLPVNLTDNIMQRVADMNPPSPPVGKPLAPWMAVGAAAVLLIVLIGAGNQYLVRFQKPYSFEARSEPTVEIIDVSVVLDIDSKPAVRNQVGRATDPSKSGGAGLQVSETTAAAPAQENSTKFSASQWTPANAPAGGPVYNIFATSKGVIYAVSPIGIYRAAAEAATWTLISTDVPTGHFQTPMAEYSDRLYIVTPREVFTSTNDGKTWGTLGSRPKGSVVDLIITEGLQAYNSQTDIAMYLAFSNRGVFRSVDAGARWIPINNGLSEKKIYTATAIGRTVFLGTDQGIYRLDVDMWKQLPVATSRVIQSLSVFEDDLYVGTGPNLLMLRSAKSNREEYAVLIDTDDNSDSGQIFRSTDLGDSWTEITPRNESFAALTPPSIKVVAAGETLLTIGTPSFRSRDRGRSWTHLGPNMNSFMLTHFPAVASDENTFFNLDGYSINRTTDAGESWHPFISGIIGTDILGLVALNNRLYVRNRSGIFQSIDDGESWAEVRVDHNEKLENAVPRRNFYGESLLAVFGSVLYGVMDGKDNLGISRLSTDGDALLPIQDIPAFDEEPLSSESLREIQEAKGVYLDSDGKEYEKMEMLLQHHAKRVRAGGFAVSGQTFYMEYKRQLFKWSPGNPKWENTGLVDTGDQSEDRGKDGFELAVSGDIVYVGKRDGKLFQSLDGGNSWRDITSNLPVQFERFNAICFSGATVYVGTDKGTLSSEAGTYWHVATDNIGERIVIDRFAVYGTTVYGAGDKGIYRLDAESRWRQISSEVPGKVLSLVVGKDKLYIATQRRGLFHISLK